MTLKRRNAVELESNIRTSRFADTREWLAPAEVADEFGVTYADVTRAIREQELPAVTPAPDGGKKASKLVHRVEVREWVDKFYVTY